MYITTILKEYPKIMKDSDISQTEYKDFSDELKTYIITSNTKNKSFCDLILFDIICRLKLNKIEVTTGNVIQIDSKSLQEFKINENFTSPKIKTGTIYGTETFDEFIKNVNVLKSFNIINNFIGNFTMSMERKLKLYKVLNFLLNNFYDTEKASASPVTQEKQNTEDLLVIFNKLINSEEIACAPRTIIQGYKEGGYNNKSGDIDYHICKANFKQTFKKISAKSAREAAKMIAMKVLKDKKKSAKFSLKRMIGKKEKCYDYDASIDKSGKITIKNQ